MMEQSMASGGEVESLVSGDFSQVWCSAVDPHATYGDVRDSCVGIMDPRRPVNGDHYRRRGVGATKLHQLLAGVWANRDLEHKGLEFVVGASSSSRIHRRRPRYEYLCRDRNTLLYV